MSVHVIIPFPVFKIQLYNLILPFFYILFSLWIISYLDNLFVFFPIIVWNIYFCCNSSNNKERSNAPILLFRIKFLCWKENKKFVKSRLKPPWKFIFFFNVSLKTFRNKKKNIENISPIGRKIIVYFFHNFFVYFVPSFRTCD